MMGEPASDRWLMVVEMARRWLEDVVRGCGWDMHDDVCECDGWIGGDG